MELILERKKYMPQTTIGELYIDGKMLCYTIEDTVRPPGIKVMNHTAIPEGEYQITLSMSNKFGRVLPMIYTEDNKYEVKKNGIGFKGIRIHKGHSHKSTSGCLIVGLSQTGATVSDSQVAEEALMTFLDKATDPITLVVINHGQKQ